MDIDSTFLNAYSSSFLDSDIFLTDQRKRGKNDLHLDEPVAKKQHVSTVSNHHHQNIIDDDEEIYDDAEIDATAVAIFFGPLSGPYLGVKHANADYFKAYVPKYDSDEDSSCYYADGDDRVFPRSFVGYRGFENLQVSQHLLPEEYASYESLANLAIAKYNVDNNLNGTHFEVVQVEQVRRRLNNFAEYYITFTARSAQDRPLETFQAKLLVDMVDKTETEVYLCRLKPK